MAVRGVGFRERVMLRTGFDEGDMLGIAAGQFAGQVIDSLLPYLKLRGLGKIAARLGLGLALVAGAAFAPVSDRVAKAMFTAGTNLIARMVTLSPGEVAEVKASVSALSNYFRTGDTGSLTAAFVGEPEGVVEEVPEEEVIEEATVAGGQEGEAGVATPSGGEAQQAAAGGEVVEEVVEEQPAQPAVVAVSGGNGR